MTQESWAYLDLKSPKYLPKVAVPLYPLLCDLKTRSSQISDSLEGTLPTWGISPSLPLSGCPTNPSEKGLMLQLLSTPNLS